MWHEEDEERAELQQQLAEAKCVIQQLAAQLDHFHDTQQQLAGATKLYAFPTFSACLMDHNSFP